LGCAQHRNATTRPSATTSALVPGLVAEYFRDAKSIDGTAGTPFLVRVEPKIEFRESEGEFCGIKLSNNFAARYEGILRVDAANSYKFTVRSDDGSRLFIDGKLVIDDVIKKDPMDPKSATLELAAGDHPIRVDYFQGLCEAGCVLYWQTPDQEERQVIPATVFFHRAGAESVAWNKKAWDDFVWDRKAWVRDFGPLYEKMQYGPFVSATISAGKDNITPKGIAIKVGTPDDQATVLFDTELLRYSAGWTGGFLHYNGVAFNGAHGPNPGADGQIVFTTPVAPGWSASSDFTDPRRVQPTTSPTDKALRLGPLPKDQAHYKGLYRNGDRVVLAYSVCGRDVLDSPGRDGGFVRTIQVMPGDRAIFLNLPGRPLEFPASESPLCAQLGMETGRVIGAVRQGDSLTELCRGGPALWTKEIITKGDRESGDGPYVIDTLTVPEANPYDSWMRFGGLDFFSDGRAALCTWSGDVWIVSGIDDKLETLNWKRYATGMFQPLGLRIVDDKIYVLGRDQITRLHDLNNDGEADFYENFNNDCVVSPSFHEFALDLQTDREGNFYFAKGGPVRPGGRGWQTITDHNGTILKVSKDGSKLEVFATGVRAPNGMGAGPNGEISVADNEGTWTPACRLSIVHKGDFLGVVDLSKRSTNPTDYDRPLCWLPHEDVDNSSGGQVWVTSDNWGPFKGEMLALSYGKCCLFKVLKEEVDGQVQGGVVQFPLKFDTGVCRARFNPIDGQLYLTGLRGWQTDAVKDGALQRMRYTGKPVNMPTGLHVREDGIEISFTRPIDRASAADVENYSIERWNYLWSQAYGSPEFSVENPKQKGHDPMEVESATVLADGKSVFLKIDDLKPVMQQKIQFKIKAGDGASMDYSIYHTINKLGKPANGDTATP
ncbi:MAG: DUF6797 domain-containing protein, partial [Tepidisphaeraceae bacterium]